jgi:hypothetical protein
LYIDTRRIYRAYVLLKGRFRVGLPSSTAAAKKQTQPRRAALLGGIWLLLMIGALPITAKAGSKGSAAYDGAVDFGPQVIQLDDGCLAVDGKMTSGAFFEDLKRIEIGRQFQFKKDGRAVSEYPDSLTTTILIAGGHCEPAVSNPGSLIFQGNAYTLRFQVDWKEGMQMRPAALSPVEAHCTGYSPIQAPGQELASAAILCQLTVDSKGVPLGDHLIVSIFSVDGKRLTRLSARP